MGSFIELNDTLRITKEQGFPDFLDINKHLESPYTMKDVDDKEFVFTSKDKIRVYQQPPVRNFLVEYIDAKWLYWGLCFITEIRHDYVNGVTSGKYKIVRLNTPEEMKHHFRLTHFLNPDEVNYFSDTR